VSWASTPSSPTSTAPPPTCAAPAASSSRRGPASVTEPTSPSVDRAIYELGVPISASATATAARARSLGPRRAGTTKEYGHSSLHAGEGRLFRGLPARQFTVWMSHGDRSSTCRRASSSPARRTTASGGDGARRAPAVRPAVPSRGRGTPSTAPRSTAPSSSTSAAATRTGIRAPASRRSWRHPARRRRRKVFFLIQRRRRFHRRLSPSARRALGPERVLGLYVDTGFMREGDAEAMQYLKSTVGERAVRLAGPQRGLLRPAARRHPSRGTSARFIGRDVHRGAGGRVRAAGSA